MRGHGVRVAIGRAGAAVIGVITTVVSEVIPIGGDDEVRFPTNARISLARWRDLRRPGVARWAEVLGSSAFALYAVGIDVHVDRQPQEMVLLDQRGSGVDTLYWVDQRHNLVHSGHLGPNGPIFALSFDRPRRGRRSPTTV